MSGNYQAVSVLAPLLRATDEPRPVLLLGAGASFRSGVPTAGEAVKQIARLVYSKRVLAGSRPPERVKPSEWEPWLRNFPWFIHGADRLSAFKCARCCPSFPMTGATMFGFDPNGTRLWLSISLKNLCDDYCRRTRPVGR
jgi:hypothetical protein